MRYAISYVSTLSEDLSPGEIKDLLEKITEYNNENDITGVILSSETNFFQLIEGEEDEIKHIYSNIEKDTRHHNIIKIVDKPVFQPAYDGYKLAIINNQTKYKGTNLRKYLRQIEVLDPPTQKAVKRVIEAMIIN